MPNPDFRASEDHDVKAVINELREGKKAKARVNPKFPRPWLCPNCCVLLI